MAGDMVAARGCFAPDAVWHFPGKNPLSGDYRGVEAILQGFFGQIRERSGGTVRVEMLDVLPSDWGAIGLQHSTGQRQGRALDVTACQVFRISDGKIVEVQPYYSDQYALDAFWAE